MNPNAKEFVPAHLLKRRQEEGDQLAEKVGQVELEDSAKNKSEAVTNNTGGDQATTINSAKDNDTTKSSDNDHTSNSQNNHSNDTSNHSPNSNHHNNTNGQTRDQEDRHLLKAGESYCEFNGEQFIIPGEEDEYEPDYQPDYEAKAGYDFGNAEDNEDEDVCNAYEQFLDNLPE